MWVIFFLGLFCRGWVFKPCLFDQGLHCIYSLVQWNLFSDVAHACNSGASSDHTEPISLHQAVCTVNPVQNDHALVQIKAVLVDRWSLLAVHFLYITVRALSCHAFHMHSIHLHVSTLTSINCWDCWKRLVTLRTCRKSQVWLYTKWVFFWKDNSLLVLCTLFSNIPILPLLACRVSGSGVVQTVFKSSGCAMYVFSHW